MQTLSSSTVTIHIKQNVQANGYSNIHFHANSPLLALLAKHWLTLRHVNYLFPHFVKMRCSAAKLTRNWHELKQPAVRLWLWVLSWRLRIPSCLKFHASEVLKKGKKKSLLILRNQKHWLFHHFCGIPFSLQFLRGYTSPFWHSTFHTARGTAAGWCYLCPS